MKKAQSIDWAFLFVKFGLILFINDHFKYF